ncbi:efflux transporter outer membrane subunit [Cupriavidus sp. 2TAF22]|uniref:efflux transporter outer membrane subunit n=1 Tax=unclassified Cupriavidus TaxID=2640874 RepID=UPI003F930052
MKTSSMPSRAPRSWRLAREAIAACVICALAGCASAPVYHPPATAVPAHFSGAAGADKGWAVAVPADMVARGSWWAVFQEPGLDALEDRVQVSNQNLKQAAARLQQARAMVNVQRAAFFPQVAAGVAVARARTSQNVLGHSLAGKTVNDYSTALSASWEPDLFGRVASATDAAHADAQASQADLEAMRLAVSSELAVDYFGLRALDLQRQLLDASLQAYTAALAMVQSQERIGAADDAAVAQAQLQVEGTRSQADELAIQRQTLEHAIAALTGTPASSFSLPPQAGPLRVPDIPVGLPSQLLQRRPDIAGAERRVAAANARIGEAHAAFFPTLALSAGAGLESSFFAPWLGAPSLFWALGPQLVGTLFDGGRRKAELAGATAAYDAGVAGYRQTVLAAFQDVEDNLSALQGLAHEADSEQRASEAAARSLALTNNRYQAGAASYLDVVTTQTLALDHQRTLVQVQGRRMQSSVRLLKALGGGWQDPAATAPGSSG